MIYINHSPKPPPSPFIKGGQNFSIMALMGENGGELEFLLEILTPSYFMKTPPPPPQKNKCLTLLFSNFFWPPTPTYLSLLTLTPTALSAVPFLWLNGGSCHNWCAILLNDNMDLHMSSLSTLVQEGPWCVFYTT